MRNKGAIPDYFKITCCGGSKILCSAPEQLPLSSIIFTSVCVYLHLFVCLHYVQYKYLTLKIYIISSYLDSSFVALARRLSATNFNCMGEQFLNFFILRVVL